MDTKLRKPKKWERYITLIRRNSDSEDVMDIYMRLNRTLVAGPPVIVILCPHVAEIIEDWMSGGDKLQLIGLYMSVSSLMVSYFKLHSGAVVLSAGGFLLQSFHYLAWERDSLANYTVQPVIEKPINEDAVLSKRLVLVRKSDPGALLMGGIMAVSAVAICSFLFWKS